MPLPQLNVHRHDQATRSRVTLSGEIDRATAPLVLTALAACLGDGIRTADVDLAAVIFCDVSGLNAFLAASALATEGGATLRLHHPPPILTRIIEITGSGFLLHEIHAVGPGPARVSAVAGGTPWPPRAD
ncbi:STAS domain-containing protein [Streptomyces sp. NPDC058947]|uniref:STAS domain-containing protein n=1 Tax=Streptomyces sp. NPDC058947 TaxID=3346675 RepID=UPI00368FA746